MKETTHDAQDPHRPRGYRRVATPLARRHIGAGRHHHIHRFRLHPGHRGLRAAAKTHIEYKYKPAVGNGHIQWSTENVPTKAFGGVAYVRDGNKTQTVIDSPAVAAVDGVNCQIPLPANPLKGLNGISPNMTVPTPQARRSTPSRRWSTTSR